MADVTPATPGQAACEAFWAAPSVHDLGYVTYGPLTAPGWDAVAEAVAAPLREEIRRLKADLTAEVLASRTLEAERTAAREQVTVLLERVTALEVRLAAAGAERDGVTSVLDRIRDVYRGHRFQSWSVAGVTVHEILHREFGEEESG